MKKVLLLFMFLVGISTNAQTSKNKTGPKVKNNKIWKNKKATTLVLVSNYKKTNLFGGKFKKLKPWNKEISDTKIVIKTRFRKKNITGPRAKNTKPWEK